MTDDIVARLRASETLEYTDHVRLCDKAADEIERLTAERDRLAVYESDDVRSVGYYMRARDRAEAERDKLRAELAAERESAESYKQTYYKSHKENCTKHNRIKSLEAERDAAVARANRAEAVVERFVAYQVKNEGLIVGPRMWADLLTEAEYVLALNKGGTNDAG